MGNTLIGSAGTRIVGIRQRHPKASSEAVFAVTVGDGRTVYMCTGPLHDAREDQVFVANAEHFVRLWRANLHEDQKPLAQGTPDSWMKDRKYAKAAGGFSRGETDPVPLAEAMLDVRENPNLSLRTTGAGWMSRRRPHDRPPLYSAGLTLGNGYTRTIWLLANGARSFPVCARASDGAGLLHRLVGEPDFPLTWIADFGREDF